MTEQKLNTDKSNMNFALLPGMRDFFPPEMRQRNAIFDVWKQVPLRYGFEEWDGPELESLQLFTAKSGEEIVQQLFPFVA